MKFASHARGWYIDVTSTWEIAENRCDWEGQVQAGLMVKNGYETVKFRASDHERSSTPRMFHSTMHGWTQPLTSTGPPTSAQGP